ncbi:MAG TPA: DUF1348 family protein [Saprospiraceae bacterium]|nr:DUF1348 family protein [Saprospiraceae bacterium]
MPGTVVTLSGYQKLTHLTASGVTATLFINGREEIVAFLTAKWQKEHQYKLRKEYWAHTGNRIAVRFEYEYHDDHGQWWRAYGNENWEFDENGLMRKRFASINDLAILSYFLGIIGKPLG